MLAVSPGRMSHSHPKRSVFEESYLVPWRAKRDRLCLPLGAERCAAETPDCSCARTPYHVAVIPGCRGLYHRNRLASRESRRGKPHPVASASRLVAGRMHRHGRGRYLLRAEPGFAGRVQSLPHFHGRVHPPGLPPGPDVRLRADPGPIRIGGLRAGVLRVPGGPPAGGRALFARDLRLLALLQPDHGRPDHVRRRDPAPDRQHRPRGAGNREIQAIRAAENLIKKCD